MPAAAKVDDCTPGPGRFYVAGGGNDAWSGTLPEVNRAKSDGPLATPQRARDAVRRWKAGGGKGQAVVFLRGGTYYLDKTLALGPEDSGTAAAPTIYRAYGREKPVLVGGRLVRDFRPYKGQILQADMASQGLGGVYFRQLFCGGKRQQLARFPNFDPQHPYTGGWLYAAGKPPPLWLDVPGTNPTTLHFKPEDVHNWAHPEEGEVVVFPRYNWWNNILPIKSIDRAKGTMTLGWRASYAIRPGDRYFVRNLLEELDAPGEWLLDRHTWRLYFWPPAELAGQPYACRRWRRLWPSITPHTSSSAA